MCRIKRYVKPVVAQATDACTQRNVFTLLSHFTLLARVCLCSGNPALEPILTSTAPKIRILAQRAEIMRHTNTLHTTRNIAVLCMHTQTHGLVIICNRWRYLLVQAISSLLKMCAFVSVSRCVCVCVHVRLRPAALCKCISVSWSNADRIKAAHRTVHMQSARRLTDARVFVSSVMMLGNGVIRNFGACVGAHRHMHISS